VSRVLSRFRRLRQARRKAQERFAADRDLADQFRTRREAATEAETKLRRLWAEQRPAGEIRGCVEDLDNALLAALESAAAAERAAMGVGAYDDPIARRKALVKPEVRVWTREVDQLRTVREELRLDVMSALGTLRPDAIPAFREGATDSRHH
jgi:hypothetical protein